MDKPDPCPSCQDQQALGFDFSMAFQPIVDVRRQEVFGYEALVRGLAGEPASDLLARVNADNRYRFDQLCRLKAVGLAVRLGIEGMLSINFLPNAVYNAETCIRATIAAARKNDFPIERIMFEVTEGERVANRDHLRRIFATYKDLGFLTAIDDFGEGHSGLNLLAEFQPDVLKLDMALTRGIHNDRIRRSIVFAIIAACHDLGIRVIAEGIETHEECAALVEEGVELFQGYLFARPAFEALPAIEAGAWPEVRPRHGSFRRRLLKLMRSRRDGAA